jgi:hypothetical protein
MRQTVDIVPVLTPVPQQYHGEPWVDRYLYADSAEDDQLTDWLEREHERWAEWKQQKFNEYLEELHAKMTMRGDKPPRGWRKAERRSFEQELAEQWRDLRWERIAAWFSEDAEG